MVPTATSKIVEQRRPRASGQPVFSICIPQFNRTSFLLEACRSIVTQNFESCEICISDDCSTDGRQQELLDFLEASPMSFAYRRLPQNHRYDANLREAIALSQGDYCFLLGNDDGLATCDTLAQLFEDIRKFAPASVVITNYRESGSSHLFRRVRTTGIAGSGPATAARAFRHFSFVSGIVLDGPTARQMATKRWDGSEMYQMFLGCRMIAAGGRLLTVDRVCINKDLQVAGESVDSYALRPRIAPCPIRERQLPMGKILPLVADALSPFQSEKDRQRSILDIAMQLFVFTYGFWLVEFRRVQSWRYAAGVYLGFQPRHTLPEVRLSLWRYYLLWGLYFWLGISGLLIPLTFFRGLQNRFYAIAKR